MPYILVRPNILPGYVTLLLLTYLLLRSWPLASSLPLYFCTTVESLAYTPTYELFLILEPLRRNFRSLCESVEMVTTQEAPGLLGADIYYRATTDVALLALRFDERALTYKQLTWVLDCAAGVGIPVLDPAKLSDTDRRQFYRSYLTSYKTRIDDLPGATAAMFELGRRLRLVHNTRARTHGENPKPVPLARLPRMSTKEMFGAPSSQPMRAPRQPLRDSIPGANSARGKLGNSPDKRQHYSLETQAAMARQAAVHRAVTARVPIHADEEEDERTARDIAPVHITDEQTHKLARGKGKKRQRKKTIPETPAARRPDSEPGARSAGIEVVDNSDHKPNRGGIPEIEVRFRRGGQWTMARLRSLSARGAYLVTSALPRLDDTVTLAFAFAGGGVTLHAKVYHLTSVRDAAETGSAGFAVRFPQTASQERTKLIGILKQALAAGVHIKPPPSREAVRFPVFWPVRVGPLNSGNKVDLLDVSAGGMFFTTKRSITNDEFMFRLPLDNGDSAIHGRVRVVRRIDADTARRRAMLPGYGVSIVELDGSARRRYTNFVSRVQARCQARIFVGAGEGRVRDVMSGLTSVGYEVIGACDPSVLAGATDLGTESVDVAVIDTSLGVANMNEFRRVFADRNIRCLSMSGQPPLQTRAAVDQCLKIA